jgi:E1-E2 ATPase
VLVLGEGDAVGADARLLEAAALRVKEASLTGESEGVLKNPATLTEPVSLGDRFDMVFKGTAITQGTGRAVVTATGTRTEMGAIAAMLEAAEEELTPLQKEVKHIGRMLGTAVVVIAAAVVATVLLFAPARAGVSLEDRKALLGHKSGDVTTHYSVPNSPRPSSTSRDSARSDRTPCCDWRLPQNSRKETPASDLVHMNARSTVAAFSARRDRTEPMRPSLTYRLPTVKPFN